MIYVVKSEDKYHNPALIWCLIYEFVVLNGSLCRDGGR